VAFLTVIDCCIVHHHLFPISDHVGFIGAFI
jgi:hypothetical protein